jgi:serine/threonine-protein kinase
VAQRTPDAEAPATPAEAPPEPLLRAETKAVGAAESNAKAKAKTPAPPVGEESAWQTSPVYARGMQLGPWRLLGPLATTDARCAPWRARRLGSAEGPEHEVALLVPHRWRAASPAAATPAQLTAELTAQLTARLREAAAAPIGLVHPHIARLLDAGVSDDGVPWIASELAEGQAIHLWCHDRALPVPARRALLEQALEAVQFGHDRGVLHGAVSTAQIIVAPDGRLRWAHFGLEALLALLGIPTSSAQEARVDAPARAYAAPEQRDGPLTVAAEVYALGVVTFEVLAGTPPWAAASGESTPATAAASAAVAPRWPAPSALAHTASHRRALRGDLDAIVGKAIAADAATRYASAAQLLEELRRAGLRRAVWARDDAGWRYHFKRFARRHRAPVVTVAVLLLAATALAVSGWFVALQRDAPVAAAGGDSAVGALLWQLLRERESGGAEVPQRDWPATLAHAEAVARASLKEQPASLGHVLAALGREQLEREAWAEGRKLLGDALPLLGEGAERDEAACDEAWAQVREADKGAVEAELRLHRIGESSRVRPITRAWCLLRLADVEQRAGSARPAHESARQAWQQWQQSPELTPQLGLRLATVMAERSAALAQFHEALGWLEEAMRRAAALRLADGPAGIALRELWSEVSLSAGDAQGALKLAETNLALLGGGGEAADNPATAPPAVLYVAATEPRLELHQLAEARAGLARAMALADARGDRPLQQRTRCLMALISLRERDVASAQRWLKQAPATDAQRSRAERDADHLCRLTNAELALVQGRPFEAQREAERLLAATEAAPRIAAAAALIRVETLLANGPPDRALNAAMQALEQARALHQVDSTQTARPSFRSGEAAVLLAQAHRANGDLERARETLDYAFQQLAATLPEAHPWRRRAESIKAAIAADALKKP